MESTWDKLRAVLFALGLHGLVAGLFLVGLLSHPLPTAVGAEGSTIEATLVSPSQQTAAITKAINPSEEVVQDAVAPVQSRSEPKSLDAQPPTAPHAAPPIPDTVDQGEARHPVEQSSDHGELPDRHTPPAENSSPTSIDEMDPPIGNDMAALLERYHAALRTTANANWNPVGVPSGVHCMVRFTQIPSGEVIAVNYEDCPLDAPARESIERAMHKGSMPYAGFEAVFSRQATIDFCTPEEACTAGAP